MIAHLLSAVCFYPCHLSKRPDPAVLAPVPSSLGDALQNKQTSFFFLPKQKHLFFLFFVFVLVPASQRGEAYSTPRNWCLIKSSFLMWDVVTWFYFFVSPSVKTRRKKTKHRRLRMDIWTHGTLTVNNLLVISIWKVWFSGMIVKHYIQKGALLSSLSISRPTSVSQIIMFLFGNASKHRQSRRRWWSEWTLNT